MQLNVLDNLAEAMKALDGKNRELFVGTIVPVHQLSSLQMRAMRGIHVIWSAV